MQENPDKPDSTGAGQQERRAARRQNADAMTASVRPKGHLSRQSARVLDFNHCGIAVVTPKQLPTERPLFVSLALGDLCIDSVVAVAHNSSTCQDGFRSGLQFRCDSELQLDGEEISAVLKAMEDRLRSDAGDDLDWVEVSCG